MMLKSRRKALAKLHAHPEGGNFKGIFREMDGLPVTIRLLDPPLHGVPPTEICRRPVAKELGVTEDKGLPAKIASLEEDFNPMLGHRGCRLGITAPEIYEMQVQAIIEAACELGQRRRQGSA